MQPFAGPSYAGVMNSTSVPRKGLPQDIAREAARVKADRVAFKTERGFAFAAPEPSSIADALQAAGNLKYKFQSRVTSGGWVDVSPYVLVRSDSSMIASFRNLDEVGLEYVGHEDVARLASTQQEKFRLAIVMAGRKLLISPNPARVKRWRRLLSRWAGGVSDPYYQYLLSYLRYLSTAFERGLELPLAQRKSGVDASALVGGAREGADWPDLVANYVLRGKLLSYSDRDGAAAMFARARSKNAESLLERFYMDTGIFTYFTSVEVQTQQNAEAAGRIRESITALSRGGATNPLAIVVSADEVFFRVYGAALYHLAQQSPDLDVVVVLCGDEAGVTRVIDDGERYRRDLDHLNHSGAPENIRYLHAPVPSIVNEPKTFYASARFFAAEQLLREYEQLYLMDIDLIAHNDPAPYLRSLSSVVFGSVHNVGSSGHAPWRRIMAGNLALNQAVRETAVLEDLCTYLARGLFNKSSWMLDQNALAFAVERNGAEYRSLHSLTRPFHQPKFRAKWERRVDLSRQAG